MAQSEVASRATLRIESPVERVMSPESPAFTFGRDPGNDLVIGINDTTISRAAGSIGCRNDLWLVSNSSTVRPLYVIGPNGLKTIVTPRSEQIIAPGRTSILVSGAAYTHELRVAVDTAPAISRPERPRRTATVGDPTTIPHLTTRERQAIAALAQRYFSAYPQHDSRPLTCSEAARSLGVPAATVRKRLERVRTKLVAAGVPALDGFDSRAEICEFLVGTGAVGQDDLESAPAAP